MITVSSSSVNQETNMGVCASAPKEHGSAVRLDFSAVQTKDVSIDSVAAVPRDDGDVFFESQPWLDSDCEDYFSVYDEMTPSRTPIHTSTRIEGTPDFVPETPSTVPKKLLIELLRESTDSNPVVVAPVPVDSPRISYDREMTPNSKPLKERSLQSSPCCLPNLVRNLSFNDRRKRLGNGNYSPSPATPGTTGSKHRIQ